VAKETKQDRIVRTILDQTVEHVIELKSLEASSRESDVERWAQSFLKNCLGYTASGGYSIRPQESKDKMRPDLVVHQNDKVAFVVEVKKYGFDLSKSNFRSGKTQLSEYLKSLGCRYGMLTNGVEWRLFDFSDIEFGGVEIAGFDFCADNDVVDTSKKAVEEHCYDILDLHESTFLAGSWPDLAKEAMAFSPETLARAILSVDVIKNISKSIRGDFEFRANHEVLTEKVYWLLEQGLNDAISGWNELKAAEFTKYIKSQKRAARKTKRTPKKESAILELSAEKLDVPSPLVQINSTVEGSKSAKVA
jgi:hypothetical protein